MVTPRVRSRTRSICQSGTRARTIGCVRIPDHRDGLALRQIAARQTVDNPGCSSLPPAGLRTSRPRRTVSRLLELVGRLLDLVGQDRGLHAVGARWPACSLPASRAARACATTSRLSTSVLTSSTSGVAFGNLLVRLDQDRGDLAGGSRPRVRLVGQPYRAIDDRAKRHRHEEQKDAQRPRDQRQPPERTPFGAGLPRTQRRRYGVRRPERHADRRPRNQRQADRRIGRLHIERDRDHQNGAIDERRRAIEREPDILARRRARRLRLRSASSQRLARYDIFCAERVARPGNADQIGEDVVAVIALQRIAVEQQRREARDQEHVVADGAEQARLGQRPAHQRERAQEQLGQHAGARDQHAPVACS